MSARKKRSSAGPEEPEGAPARSSRPPKPSSPKPSSPKPSSPKLSPRAAGPIHTKTGAKSGAKSGSKTIPPAEAAPKRAPKARPDDEAAPRKRTKLPPERPGQPGGKRALNRDVRIAALMESGLKLFLERGVESVTIDEIAREAGMAKGNFYRYFDDKRALVDRLVLAVAADVRTAMRKCAVSLGRAADATEMGVAYAMLAIEIAQATTTRLDVVRLYLQENRAPATPSTAGVRALADELADGAVKLTVAAVDRGLLRVSDPRVSGLAVVGAIEQLAISVLRGQLDAPPLEVGRIVVSMVLDGIRAR